MFTGIIEEVGTIQNIASKQDIHQYQIHASSEFIQGMSLGDSVAVNGVCLTAYDIQAQSFSVDVSEETQKCTSFGTNMNNIEVNLEHAVTPTTRLGGHFVSGHVDGLGELLRREDKENETILWIQVPSDLSKFITVKGSICINGVSLTINEVKDNQCCVTVIPHTSANTNLDSIKANDKLNVEVDLIARYLERFVQANI